MLLQTSVPLPCSRSRMKTSADACIQRWRGIYPPGFNSTLVVEFLTALTLSLRRRYGIRFSGSTVSLHMWHLPFSSKIFFLAHRSHRAAAHQETVFCSLKFEWNIRYGLDSHRHGLAWTKIVSRMHVSKNFVSRSQGDPKTFQDRV